MTSHPGLRLRRTVPGEMAWHFRRRYPAWFDAVDRARRAAAKDPPLRDLFRAVYCPRDVSAYYFSLQEGAHRIHAVAGQAFAAWRMGKSIYRFDPDFASALINTPLDTALPVGMLRQLPEWGAWIETSGILPGLDGFFVVTDGSLATGFDRVQITMVAGGGMNTIPIDLSRDGMSLRDNLWHTGREMGIDMAEDEGLEENASVFVAAINMALYLCSAEPDYLGSDRPRNPAPARSKNGARLLPASAPRYWEIGKTIGERLREATARQSPDERNAPRPHLRRAHWHTYRTGKGRAGYRVRWLHPILVGYNNDGGSNDE